MNLDNYIPTPEQLKWFIETYGASLLFFVLAVFTPYSIIAKALYAVLIHCFALFVYMNITESEIAIYTGTEHTLTVAILTQAICTSILAYFNSFYLGFVTFVVFVLLGILYFNKYGRKEDDNEAA